MEKFKLFAAFQDLALLLTNLVASSFVDLVLGQQQFHKPLHDLQADIVFRFFEPELAGFTEDRNQLVGDVSNLVARKFHRVTGVSARSTNYLSFSNQLIFDLAEHVGVADLVLAHVVRVLLENVADFVVQPIFGGEFRHDHLADFDRTFGGIPDFYVNRVDPLDQLAGEILD